MAARNLVLWTLAGLALLFFAGDVFAQSVDGTAKFEGLLDLVKSNANSWAATLRGHAISLFWGLAAIQFVVAFFSLAFKGADLGEIVGELVRQVLTIGFFFALLTYSVEWATAIVDSFRQAGAEAIGASSALRPGDMFGFAVEFSEKISEGVTDTWNPAAALAISLAALVVLLCFAFIAAFMGLTLVESYVVINGSVLFMAFGGSHWTRDIAIATLKYAVSVGAKLFVLTLLVGMVMTSSKQWSAAYTNDSASMWTMVGLALVCAYLCKTIPELVQGFISGSSVGGGNTVGGMAAGAMAGAMAAAAAVKTAGASAVAGAAAKAGGAAGLQSGLASSIANAPSLGAGPAPGAAAAASSAGSSTAAPVGSRLGGGQHAAAAPAPKADSGKSSTAAPQGMGDQAKSAEGTPAAGDTDTSPPKAGPSLGAVANKATEAMTRTMSTLAAISVPGMESAPAMAGPSVNLDAEDRRDLAPSTPPAAAVAAQEENVIRPAPPAAPAPTPDPGKGGKA